MKTIYTYECTDRSCNHVQKKTGTRRSQMRCETCGRQANLIDTEKIG